MLGRDSMGIGVGNGIGGVLVGFEVGVLVDEVGKGMGLFLEGWGEGGEGIEDVKKVGV